MSEGVGVLEIKMGASQSGPTKRLVDDLHRARKICTRMRMEAIRFWEAWRFWNPDWTPQEYTTKKGEIRKESEIFPESWQRECYGRLADYGAEWSSHFPAAITQEIVADLKTKTPYNRDHDGPKEDRPKYRWQSILAGLESRPTYRDPTIPMPVAVTLFGYRGEVFCKDPKKIAQGDLSRARDLARDHAIVSFPLFSLRSGRRSRRMFVRLNVRPLSRGHKDLLAKIAHGEIAMLDSRFIFRSDQAKKGWYFQLVYKAPVNDLGLNRDNVATLLPLLDQEGRFGFRIETKIGERVKSWNVGAGEMAIFQFKTLAERRDALRDHYAKGVGAGHGRGRFYEKTRPYSRAGYGIQKRYRYQIWSEIKRFMTRFGCGTLIYREPGSFARTQTYCGKNLDFDWTLFQGMLAHKCNWHKIDYPKPERISIGDLRERLGKAKTPGPTREGANTNKPKANVKSPKQPVAKNKTNQGGKQDRSKKTRRK